jgi:hypothetical protein
MFICMCLCMYVCIYTYIIIQTLLGFRITGSSIDSDEKVEFGINSISVYVFVYVCMYIYMSIYLRLF